MDHKREASKYVRQYGEVIQSPDEVAFRIALIHALLHLAEQVEKLTNVRSQK